MIKSHNEHEKIVYKLCNSCINNIQNLTETLLSFSYQLRSKVDLNYHS